MIVYSSDVVSGRPYVLSFLEKMKLSNPKSRVLDVGGVADSWADDYVDVYLDFSKGNKVIRGDVCLPDVWNKLDGEIFDFVICSHLLEDVRDPLFVATKIWQHGRQGSVAVPNKHTEMMFYEGQTYVGYCHHRWIFTLKNDLLYALPKHAVCSQFSKSEYHQLLTWLDREKVSGELFAHWQDSFLIKIDDYPAPNCDSLLLKYVEDLKEGL